MAEVWACICVHICIGWVMQHADQIMISKRIVGDGSAAFFEGARSAGVLCSGCCFCPMSLSLAPQTGDVSFV
jgi:hypothetical protein